MVISLIFGCDIRALSACNKHQRLVYCHCGIGIMGISDRYDIMLEARGDLPAHGDPMPKNLDGNCHQHVLVWCAILGMAENVISSGT